MEIEYVGRTYEVWAKFGYLTKVLQDVEVMG